VSIIVNRDKKVWKVKEVKIYKDLFIKVKVKMNKKAKKANKKVKYKKVKIHIKYQRRTIPINNLQ